MDVWAVIHTSNDNEPTPLRSLHATFEDADKAAQREITELGMTIESFKVIGEESNGYRLYKWNKVGNYEFFEVECYEVYGA